MLLPLVYVEKIGEPWAEARLGVPEQALAEIHLHVGFGVVYSGT